MLIDHHVPEGAMDDLRARRFGFSVSVEPGEKDGRVQLPHENHEQRSRRHQFVLPPPFWLLPDDQHGGSGHNRSRSRRNARIHRLMRLEKQPGDEDDEQ